MSLSENLRLRRNVIRWGQHDDREGAILGLMELLTGKLSKQEFAKKFTKELQASSPCEVQFDEAQFGLRVGEGNGSGWILLANFYAEYMRTPRLKRDQAVRTMVSNRMAEMRGYEENPPRKDDLLPVVRDHSHAWISGMQIKKLMPEAPNPLKGTPLGEDHSVLLVLDTPTSMRYLGEKELSKLEMSYEQAAEEALHNLRSISADKWLSLGSQAYVGQWNDSYDCSRLLLTDLIHRLDISGRPIAITPCRGVLMVASENNVEGQRAIMQLALGVLDENSRWTSPEVLVLENDRWQPFVLTDPVCVSVQHEMTVRMRKSVYDQQKQLLDEANQVSGQDVFVANFMAYKKSDGVLSVCSWGQGLDSWLPQTEFIVFVDAANEKSSGMVPWELAMRHVGDLLTPVLGTVPPRYQTRGYPDEECLQKMSNLLAA